jgi:hypothetical protein
MNQKEVVDTLEAKISQALLNSAMVLLAMRLQD